MNDQAGVATAASWPGADRPVQKLHYDGTIGALYGIFIKNLLLGIITLTIYRFWGKTNLRRYAWSHMTLQGHRFEYTGRGGELFIGFLIVTALYAVVTIGFSILSVALGEEFSNYGSLLLLLVVVYLAYVAQYAAQNYRLTRTLWCGIRGGMSGSAWRYGIKAMLFMVLNLVTLNFALPWTTLRLAEDRFNHSYFGNAKASLQASAKPLYAPYLLGYALMVVGLAILVGILVMIASAIGVLNTLDIYFDAAAANEPADLTQEQFDAFANSLIGLVIAGYLGFLVVAAIAFAPFAAALIREIARNLRLAELRFDSEVTAGRYMGLWIGNALWIVLTLGFGLPVAVQRSLRFFADRIEIQGEVDAERLQQTTLDRPQTGEGLLEAFDPGFF